MYEMIDNPFVTLTFIAGPAMLTNACAILQNSASMRYSLAISQWREFRASMIAGDNLLSRHYADMDAAIHIAQRRIRLLLRGLDCLYAAVAFFGIGALLGLIGAILASEGRHVLPIWLVVGATTVGFGLLLWAMAMFISESRCATGLLRLQLNNTDAPSP
ncbi:hypothetical protein ACFB49_19350 [Sphingomonas sp. DBB INV C78]|uniref:DUF2721 domain-containing protein n=1 Tax=Sphingomonas sp. DBB INV C78 TaxID=3349434 RepID=UPI0036D25BD2